MNEVPSITAALPSAVQQAVLSAVEDASIPMHSVAPVAAAVAVTQQIIDTLKADPNVQHDTNNEPWYKSRVTIGSYVAMLSPVIGSLLGRAVTPDEQAAATLGITLLGTLAGGAFALYGRWKARRPIGA